MAGTTTTTISYNDIKNNFDDSDNIDGDDDFNNRKDINKNNYINTNTNICNNNINICNNNINICNNNIDISNKNIDNNNIQSNKNNKKDINKSHNNIHCCQMFVQLNSSPSFYFLLLATGKNAANPTALTMNGVQLNETSEIKCCAANLAVKHFMAILIKNLFETK
ncbi:hypothetical protein HELRODRAFT_175068 [Helobdella robusta]|uniref:Uncharacterized protein n=1 Tax=Helobdella robusta TaxID=6412 RepID=T1F8T0_HELRO|nr:hypothetical protein HELRODRAFT_175068 [Helobdella robusta]ESO01041.1 hypothetical protein HELRODRAFT_175068 [Helobdella robusta]